MTPPASSWHGVEPWALTWSRFGLDRLAQVESLFAIGNGNIGWRAVLDEGQPVGSPGCYLNGLYERRPLPHAEQGYAFPESGESIVSAPDGTRVRLVVDGEPFDVRRGELRRHELRLDFRAGTLRREVEWVSPAGRGIRLTSTRLVSFAERALAAVRVEVEPLEGAVAVEVRSELRADVQPDSEQEDPRVTAALADPYEAVAHEPGERPLPVHRTRGSGITVVAGMAHRVAAPDEVRVRTETTPDVATTTVRARLVPGESLRLDKFVGLARSGPGRGDPREEVLGALDRAEHLGWDGLASAQRAWLDEFWAVADVELDGDAVLQQSVRYAVFQTVQATARADGGPVPGKGLTGNGYDGHAFWETEIFVAPLLDHLLPRAAADALRWRHSVLPHARARAAELRLGGAAFAWRTISGPESSGYWPAGTAAFHISADIAHAVVRHVRVTGDRDLERAIGVELLVETARLWCSLGYLDAEETFHLDGMTGPDEYSALHDDNAYTLLMAQANLRSAIDVVGRHPERARSLGVTETDVDAWRRVADAVRLPVGADGVHEQSRGFTRRERWDFDATPTRCYPLDHHYPYVELYRKQVVKQPDLVLALQLHPEAFTRDEALRDFAYYEPLTVRDSSLSASTSGIVAARLGHLGLALDYLREGARLDLDDLHGSVAAGLHLGCLAGVWGTVVAGFAGLRWDDATPSFAPRLPPGIPRLAFGLRIGAGILRVEIGERQARYAWSGEAARVIRHHGTDATLAPDGTVALPIPATTPAGDPPTQPRGRSPRDVLRGGEDE